MNMYVVEVIETAHWEFHIQADDEDEARNRVESALDETQADPSFFDREVNVRWLPTDTDQFDYGDDEVRRGSMSALSANAPPRPKSTKEMEAEANLAARDERWRPIIPMHESALEKFEAECAEFVRNAEEGQG